VIARPDPASSSVANRTGTVVLTGKPVAHGLTQKLSSYSHEDQGWPANWRGRATPSSAAARTSGLVRSDGAEKLFAHSIHLVRTSRPAYSLTSVGRHYVLLFYLLISSPSLPAYPFTSVSRRYVLLYYLLVSSPSLPAYPFTRLARFLNVYSRNRIS